MLIALDVYSCVHTVIIGIHGVLLKDVAVGAPAGRSRWLEGHIRLFFALNLDTAP